MKKLSTLFVLLLICLESQAQTYTVNLVKNINIGGDCNPRWFTVWDSSLYFMGSDGSSIQTLFRMTPSTLPVPCPGLPASSIVGDGSVSSNRPMGLLNNQLYAPVFATASGREVFRYDGSTAPVLVHDINPGTAGSAPNYLVPFNNKLYFQAMSPALGMELWMHDPLSNTTTCLTDINPGTAPSTIAQITPYNNQLYFAGSNGNDTLIENTGLELYRYDPATNTTALVADINPGYLPSNPTALMVANGKLYFVAGETQYGRELYEFDGSNVTRLTDINPGPAQGVYTSDHSFPVWFNGKIYLAANDNANLINLGIFDPANNAVNIVYCSGNTQSGNPRYFKVWDNRVFFTNADSLSGFEIWATDGVNPPVMIYDVRPGQAGSLPKFYTEFAGSLYFNASNDTSTQEELFRLKKIETVEPSGLSTMAKELPLRLFPNPAHGVVHLAISYQGPMRYRLCSMAGICISQGLVAEDQSISLQDISPGVYVCYIYPLSGEQRMQGRLSIY